MRKHLEDLKGLVEKSALESRTLTKARIQRKQETPTEDKGDSYKYLMQSLCCDRQVARRKGRVAHLAYGFLLGRSYYALEAKTETTRHNMWPIAKDVALLTGETEATIRKWMGVASEEDEEAIKLVEEIDTEGDKNWREKVKDLRQSLKKLFFRIKTASYFKPWNRMKNKRREEMSPSGKYRLVLDYFTTGKGTWNYSQGTLYKVGQDIPVAVIQRNYGGFPYLFIEGHPKGDFFIGGEDYQGQTVIELNTGARRDLLPEEAKAGHGFCWASYKYNTDHQLLIVSGCFWACPYEVRLYDFSDPMNGWPQLKFYDKYGKETYIDDNSDKLPDVSPDGVIKVFQTVDIYDYEERYKVEGHEDVKWIGDDPDDPDNDERVTVVAKTLYKIQDKKLVFQSEWVSDHEKAYRKRQEEARRKYEEKIANFKASDPLYHAYVEGLKDPVFSPADYHSQGITYDNWCPDFKGHETRWCRDIVTSGSYKVSLEWAIETGPIKLIIYKDGKKVEDKFFMEHSEESMKTALAYTKGIMQEKAA